MIWTFEELVRDYHDDLYALLRRYLATGRQFLLRSDLWDIFREFCDEAAEGGERLRGSELARIVGAAQEAVLDPPWLYTAIRPRVARWYRNNFV